MKNTYMEPRATRREARTLAGRFRGGKLAPVYATAIRGSEGGMLAQTATIELDPVMGRLLTPVVAEMISVFVPLQAIENLKFPADQYAGMTEVMREKLLTGAPLFTTEAESEISKRCGVNPKSVAGVKVVSETVRLAHNAAVNHLRQRKYVKAAQLVAASAVVTPALIGQSALERLNGVLDPEDRINGAVDLTFPTVNLPVLGLRADGSTSTSSQPLNADGSLGTASTTLRRPLVINDTSNATRQVYAQLSDASAGSVSLQDFYEAQRMDTLVRKMRQIVDDNPEYGEEMVLRWAHGLQIDDGKTPWVIAERSQTFQPNIVPAMDSAGVTADTMRSDMMQTIEFMVPVPKTELGGIVITFLTVKPDESLASQPHPFLADSWVADNYVADEMELDPVAVTIRELDSDCLQASENTVAMYTGFQALKQTYVHYGFNRHLNPALVASKTAIWQLQIPLSLTPESIIYPETLSHYPFADQNAEVATYSIQSNMVLQTPMIFGPTPVEELAVIETGDVFDEIP